MAKGGHLFSAYTDDLAHGSNAGKDSCSGSLRNHSVRRCRFVMLDTGC